MRNGEFGVVVNNLNTIPVVFVQCPVLKKVYSD